MLFCQNCIDYTDTLKCFRSSKFEKKPIRIGTKTVLADTIDFYDFPLVTDWNVDCLPEVMVRNFNYLLKATTLNKNKLLLEFSTFRDDNRFSTRTLLDVDMDEKPEIFMLIDDFFGPNEGKIKCISNVGTLRWVSDFPASQYNPYYRSGGLATADFNMDGVPELYINNKIFNAQTGKLLVDGGSNAIGVSRDTFLGISFPVSVAAQLDDDPTDLELAAGYSIYKVKITNKNGRVGNSMTASNIMVDKEYRDGLTSIADVNLDGKLDVVVASARANNSGLVYAYCLDNTGNPKLIAKCYPPSPSNYMGIVSIGKISNSIYPSLIFDRVNFSYSYVYNGTGQFQLQWSLPNQDESGSLGVSLFDFDGDGRQEMVLRDSLHLKILAYNDTIPYVVDKIDCMAGTFYEYPTIVGIDEQGSSRICTVCNDTNYIGHLSIFGPPDSLPWAPARPIWNQYAYNPLYINDDLTVPRVQKNQATYQNGRYNNFMAQKTLLDSAGNYKVPAASLYGTIFCIRYDESTNEYIVNFDLYNRSDASAQADSSLAVSFYNGNPETGGALLGIYYTQTKLLPGDSLIGLEISLKAQNLKELYLVVNSSRNNSGPFGDKDFILLECDYTDNFFHSLDLPELEYRNAEICRGSSYDFYGRPIQDTGRYVHVLSSEKGCDSLIVYLDLNLLDSVTVMQNISICEKYVWNDKEYTSSGRYMYDTLSANGCDSLTILDLQIYPKSEQIIFDSACISYNWNGNVYTNSGTYTYQGQTDHSCDSIIILNLTIQAADTIIQNTRACGNYNWNGNVYTNSGTYTFNGQNENGCDSIVFLNLSIDTILYSNEFISSCDQYVWNGKSYNTTGQYRDTFSSINGCDSIVTLNLALNQSKSIIQTQTACDSFLWLGKNYKESGLYYDTLSTTKGCDSIINLYLTIHSTKNIKQQKTACDSLEWNGSTYKQSGIYISKNQSQHSCDSITELELTIHPSTRTILMHSACDSFEWNRNVIKQSGIYTQILSNQYSCDSLVTLHIEIFPSTRILDTVHACEEYIDPITGNRITKDEVLSFNQQTEHGCDSVLNKVVYIHPQYFYSDTVYTQQNYHWSINNKNYGESGTYTANFQTKEQCDSIYTLYLIIEDDIEIYAPNVIHPGSGIATNKYFYLITSGEIDRIEYLNIYDRWGELVWAKENFGANIPELGWDGSFRAEQMNPAVFVWIAEIRLKNGKQLTLHGDLTVLQ
ncbi:MAG: gliding motility-associated C-terminal domain-containing protein [Saprospiraceae bacterium]|nr:gliding motility-associated C-terminal domain-containing protein [Saprospiraceae bacterium]